MEQLKLVEESRMVIPRECIELRDLIGKGIVTRSKTFDPACVSIVLDIAVY